MYFVPIYSGYACISRYILCKIRKLLGLAKNTAFAHISRKMRTYFRGGTVLYRVGALEDTTNFAYMQAFGAFSSNKM